MAERLIFAFLVGGAFCAIAQVLIDETKLTTARVMVIYVISGVILSYLGLYTPLVEFAGAGATVPIIGFGHALAQGILKAMEEEGIYGVLTGGLVATAGGIASVILFGYIAALLGKSKPK